MPVEYLVLILPSCQLNTSERLETILLCHTCLLGFWRDFLVAIAVVFGKIPIELEIKKLSSKNLILFTSVIMLSPIRNHTTHTRAVNISLRYPRLRYCGNRSTIAVTTPSIPTNLKTRLRKLSCGCQNPNKSVQDTQKFPVRIEIALRWLNSNLKYAHSPSCDQPRSQGFPVSPSARKPWERRRLAIH